MDFLIKTERLQLRQFLPGDAKGMYDLNDDSLVLQYTGDAPFASIAAAEEFIRNYDHYENYGMGRWTIIRKNDGRYLGWCGLKTHSDQTIDLGFRLLRKYWNRGYASEAAKACIDYGFSSLGLREITGRADVRNLASIKVLEKVGMKWIRNESIEGIGDGVIYRIER